MDKSINRVNEPLTPKEAEEQINIKVGNKNGRVWIAFSKKIEIFGLTPPEVVSYVQAIVANLKEIESQQQPRIVVPNQQVKYNGKVPKKKHKRRG